MHIIKNADQPGLWLRFSTGCSQHISQLWLDSWTLSRLIDSLWRASSLLTPVSIVAGNRK